MTTEEAVLGPATAGGARGAAPDRYRPSSASGPGADLILLDAPSHAYLAYRPGVPQIAAVWQAGRLVVGTGPLAAAAAGSLAQGAKPGPGPAPRTWRPG